MGWTAILDLDAWAASRGGRTSRLVGERRHAVDYEEIEEGLVCIGAPIRDHTGHVVAAVSIAGPSSRLRPETIEGHASDVVDVAHGMSAVLGCPPDLLGPAPGPVRTSGGGGSTEARRT